MVVDGAEVAVDGAEVAVDLVAEGVVNLGEVVRATLGEPPLT